MAGFPASKNGEFDGAYPAGSDGVGALSMIDEDTEKNAPSSNGKRDSRIAVSEVQQGPASAPSKRSKFRLF